MNITNDIKYIGVNDCTTDLFEGLYRIPEGISYNSYVIMDEKIAVMDSVDAGFRQEWLQNLEISLKGRLPDYLIVHHMEPDHSSSILYFMEKYPKVCLVASEKAFVMMKHFFHREWEKTLIIKDGDKLSLGRHKLEFAAAPMVHWPEVMVTYDAAEEVLFSADGFGRFGALDVDKFCMDKKREITEDVNGWENEARRYYIGIVGKYGFFVKKLLAKTQKWNIQKICPLHGPVLSENLEYYIGLYQKWASYEPEEEGVFIAYTSVYGNTKHAVNLLEGKLREEGCSKVVVRDLARCDMSEAVALAFRYSKLVLATTTYNTQVFPPMREFIRWLTERNFANHTVAFMENGSWMPIVARLMKEEFLHSRGISFAENTVTIRSALNEDSIKQLDALAKELTGRDRV